MEIICAGIQLLITDSSLKPQLMIQRAILNRIIIISFMIVVGFCLARGIYYQSVMGIILALVSLSAGVYFLYLLAKAKQEMELLENDK